MDPRCKRRWFGEPPHDYEIISQSTLVCAAAKESIRKADAFFSVSERLLNAATPKLITIFKCRLCGAVTCTEHKP